MKQKVEEVITDRVLSEKLEVDEEGQLQEWPDSMIQMGEKGMKTLKMRVFHNAEVIELKGSVEGIGVGNDSHAQENADCAPIGGHGEY